jgi:hypothetical protein
MLYSTTNKEDRNNGNRIPKGREKKPLWSWGLRRKKGEELLAQVRGQQLEQSKQAIVYDKS